MVESIAQMFLTFLFDLARVEIVLATPVSGFLHLPSDHRDSKYK